jgi:hypothetical protein
MCPFDFEDYKIDPLGTDYQVKHDAFVDAMEAAFNNSIAANAVTTAIDWQASDYHTNTMAGSTTFTFSNVPSGISMIFLRLTVTSGTPTFPAAVIWNEGITPTFTAGKTHLIVFVTEDGGTTVRAGALMNYAS